MKPTYSCRRSDIAIGQKVSRSEVQYIEDVAYRRCNITAVYHGGGGDVKLVKLQILPTSWWTSLYFMIVYCVNRFGFKNYRFVFFKTNNAIENIHGRCEGRVQSIHEPSNWRNLTSGAS